MAGNRHRGVTLIELLVVMGVMMMLAGIAILSYSKLDGIARNNDTRARLQMCASIEGEYEAQAPTNLIEGLEAIQNPYPVAGTVLGPDVPLYQLGTVVLFTQGEQFQQNDSPLLYVPNPWPPGVGPLPGQSQMPFLYVPSNPGNIKPGNINRYSTPYLVSTPWGPMYYQNRTVLNTSVIMRYYSTMPTMQKMLGDLPTSFFLPPNPDIQVYTDPTTGVILPSMALPKGFGGPLGGIGALVMVDSWKNPIIYVPSYGLSGVYVGRVPATLTQSGVPGLPYRVRSVDGRPFWASAGPDGDFSQGDDNLYSCPVTYSQSAN